MWKDKGSSLRSNSRSSRNTFELKVSIGNFQRFGIEAKSIPNTSLLVRNGVVRSLLWQQYCCSSNINTLCWCVFSIEFGFRMRVFRTRHRVSSGKLQLFFAVNCPEKVWRFAGNLRRPKLRRRLQRRRIAFLVSSNSTVKRFSFKESCLRNFQSFWNSNTVFSGVAGLC